MTDSVSALFGSSTSKPKRVRRVKVAAPTDVSTVDNALVAMHSVFGASHDLDIEYLPVADDGPDVRFIGAADKPSIDAEAIVDSLITAQVSIDSSESSAIIAMIDAVRSGAGDVKAFVNCFAARAKGRMSDKSIPVRKSNLKGVLSFALDNETFADIVRSEALGLQAAYALRAEMIPRNSRQKTESVATVDAIDVDDAIDGADVLRQHLTNAIHAAESIGRPDVADDIRAILESVLCDVVS